MIRELRTETPVVYVVDDDPQACCAVAALVQSFGHQVRSFESPVAFMQDVDDRRPGCVVLDQHMPGMDGAEVQRQLNERGLSLPVIIVTGRVDAPTTQRFLRRGAVCVLGKPYQDDELWNCVQEAVSRSQQELKKRQYHASLERRFRQLAQSDRAVLELMLQGMKNRSIANRLGVSLRTVENRRRRVFNVMQAGSLAELTRLVVEYEHKLLPIRNLQESWMNLPYEAPARQSGSAT